MTIEEIKELEGLTKYQLYKRQIREQAKERKKENKEAFQRYFDESCKKYKED